MRFGDLTFEEIKEYAEAGWLAVVPTGCTEQQGPHLPVDFDTWFAEAVCAAAAERAASEHAVHALVLPALPFGPTPEHRAFGSGYIDLPQEVHEAAVAAILNSLAEQGFERIIVWRGCGGHDLDEVVERFNLAHLDRARAFLPELPYHGIWCRIGNPENPGGHADAFATSIALSLRPGSVQVDRISDPENEPVDWGDPNLDFSQYSSTGVIGDPTEATAELGARLWAAVVESVAETFSTTRQKMLSLPGWRSERNNRDERCYEAYCYPVDPWLSCCPRTSRKRGWVVWCQTGEFIGEASAAIICLTRGKHHSLSRW